MKFHRRPQHPPIIKDLFKDKTRLIGNSVCPHPMRAVVAANVRPWKAAA